jgi:hypothetical protein
MMSDQGETSAAERAAEEVASMVAGRVREALQSADREVAEVRRQARARAEGERANVRQAAELVAARIDLVEEEVHQLLQQLRDEIAATVAEAEGAAEARPIQPAEIARLPSATTRRGGGGLFRRRRAAAVRCGVCGRTTDAGREPLDRWQRRRDVCLCPQCQAAGWRIPEGGTVPYRPAQQIRS